MTRTFLLSILLAASTAAGVTLPVAAPDASIVKTIGSRFDIPKILLTVNTPIPGFPDFPSHSPGTQYPVPSSRHPVITPHSPLPVPPHGQKYLLSSSWGTYYGGSGQDWADNVAVDAAGNIYMSGTTRSPDGIATTGAHQTVFVGGENDGYLVKFNADGVRQWATYYGGEADDEMGGIAVDAGGNVYVAGFTNSANNIATSGAHQSSYAGGGGTGKKGDAFLVKFNSSGVRQWATYYGSSNQDSGTDVAVDANGNVYLVGFTQGGPGLATAGAHQETYGGYWWDALIVKFNSSGIRQWATYYGGADEDKAECVALDAAGNVIIAGVTADADNIATAGAHQESFGGSYDGFIAKFNPNGARQWGTYYGGSEYDWFFDIAVDASGNVHAVGTTTSTDNIASASAHQTTLGGHYDAFYVKLSKDGVRQWATYHGGSSNDRVSGITIDNIGNTYMSGETISNDMFTTSNAFKPTIGGGTDAFVVRFDANGTVLLSTFFGGPGADFGKKMAFESGGNVYLTGYTGSTTGISTPGAHQPARNQHEDAFLVKSNFIASPPIAPTELQAAASTCTDIDLTWVDNSDNEISFIVEREQSPGNWVAAASVPANSTAATVSDNLPSTKYSFRVIADRMGAKSGPSNTAVATTPAFPAPADLRAVSIAARSVDLKWTRSSNYATRFVIEQRTGTSQWTALDTVQAETDVVTIQGLQPATGYSFCVRGLRGLAVSPSSNILDVRTKLFLPAPSNFQVSAHSAAEARLSWTDNATSETGYEIEQRSPLQPWSPVTTTGVDATSYARAGLTPDSTYIFRVRAVGDDAASDWSEERMVVMSAPPEAPLALAAFALDYKSVRLSWKRGSANVKTHEIQRREQGGNWTTAMTAAGGDTTAWDDGLKDETTYTYRVRAVNDAGASAWSNEADVTTLALPLPGRPFGLAAASTGPFSIRLTWIAPSPSVESGFEVEESLTDKESDFKRIMPDAGSGARSYDRTGLQPSTTYYYRVRAVNKSGASEYSGIANAKTTASVPTPPGPPNALAASPLSTSSISLTWEISDTTFVESYDLERSPTSDPGGFALIQAGPTAVDRSFTDTGLAMNTMYFYRIRAVNRYGNSSWSNTANAKTNDITVTPELLAAMSGKENLITQLEILIPQGSSDMSALRLLLGDHARGYDETAAKVLISQWRASGVSDPAAATDAMKRYTLTEQALLLAYGNDTDFPGAKEMAREAVYSPALCAKNLAALALLWKAERSRIAQERLQLYDAVMEDLTFAVLDGENALSAMTGARDAAGSASLHAEAVRHSGHVAELNSGMLTSILPYYQQRFLGNDYFSATQPMISSYADRTGRVDITGTYDSAAVKSAGHTDEVKTTTTALKTDFTTYSNGLTELDAAYAISSSGNVDLGPFLRKMVNLRPRLIDNVRKAILGGETPLTRAAYLTSATPLPGIGSLPSEINSAAKAAFDPVTHSVTGAGNIFRALSKSNPVEKSADQAALDADRSLLLELRAMVIEKDTGYISSRFHVLRSSGRGATAELARRSRPLEGITPSGLLADASFREVCLDALAKSNRARSLRTVLSVARADYLVDAQEAKNAPLVAEIDTILGYFDQAAAALMDIGSAAASKITEPVLSLETASLLPLSPSSPLRCRFIFTVRNTGGSEAKATTARVTSLDATVTPLSPFTFTLGDMQKGAARADSMDMQIPAGTESVTFAVEMAVEKGRTFVDHVTLAVPEGTTGIRTTAPLPGAITLSQNYPNPFNPSTLIEYILPRPMAVCLVITNALGMEVARLVNGEHKPAGAHTTRFDASVLPSGVYTYRLEAGGMVLARRMAVVK